MRLDYCFLFLLDSESALQSHEMTVDLRSKGFLWDQTIASLALPLKFVPYTSLVCQTPVLSKPVHDGAYFAMVYYHI